MKLCKRCRQWKPRSEFYRHCHTSDGLHLNCKPCHYAMKEAAFKAKPENRERKLARQREYIQRPEVKEMRADVERMKRFRMRLAKERGSGA